MQDYDTEIVVTSVMKYGKDPLKMGTRLELLLINPELCGNSDKFVGSVPVTQWYQGTDVFDKVIKENLILKNSIGHFAVRKDYKDPTKLSSRLESITYKDNVISLLQSNAR